MYNSETGILINGLSILFNLISFYFFISYRIRIWIRNPLFFQPNRSFDSGKNYLYQYAGSFTHLFYFMSNPEWKIANK